MTGYLSTSVRAGSCASWVTGHSLFNQRSAADNANTNDPFDAALAFPGFASTEIADAAFRLKGNNRPVFSSASNKELGAVIYGPT